MLPPNAAALADSVDDLLRPARPAARGAERTQVLADRAGPIARVVLALDAHDFAAVPIDAPDAVLLHRHWHAPLDRLPSAVAVLACHEPLDLGLGLASTPALHRALGLRELETIGARDGAPLAALCEPDAPASLGELRARVRAAFGAIEAEEPAGDDGDPVTRVVTARAMTPAIVRAAASAGATAYVTGQLRAAACAAARACRVHVLAVGHRRSERWALHVLAATLRTRWPGLAAEVAMDGEDAA